MSEFMDEAKKLASEHSEQADQGLDKAAEMAGEKTGGKYDSQIQAGEQKAEDFLGVQDQETGQPGQPGTVARARAPARHDGGPPAARCPAPSPAGRPGQ